MWTAPTGQRGQASFAPAPFYRLERWTSEIETRRPARRTSRCRQLFVFIGTVVVVQNALMAYNFAMSRVTKTSSVGQVAERDDVFNVMVNATVSEFTVANGKTNLVLTFVSDTKQLEHSPVVSDKKPPEPQPDSTTTIAVPVPNEVKVPMTEHLYYRKQPTMISPYIHRVRLAPSGVCRSDTRMLIVVHSHPTNADRRAAIRETWGETTRTGSWPEAPSSASWPCCKQLEVVFVVGMHRDPSINAAIEEELLGNQDLIQGDFIDDYRNMTLKSLLDFKFAIDRCAQIEFLLKSDDDMILNLPYLLNVIHSEMKPKPRSMMGPYNAASMVYRAGVWAVTQDEFPFDRYPPYYSGATYIISASLISELFETAQYVRPIFIDDVFVTGILGRILGVTYIRRTGFAFWGTRRPTACDIINNAVLTGTKMHPQRLMELWNEITMRPTC